jgi:diaminopimelate decarboxylase
LAPYNGNQIQWNFGKSNFYKSVLTPQKPAMKYAKDLGLGFESASFGELSQAINTGVDPQVTVTFSTFS